MGGSRKPLGPSTNLGKISGISGNGNLLTYTSSTGLTWGAYQWIKTSSTGVQTPIAGATSSTWLQTGLVAGDSVSCQVTNPQYMPTSIMGSSPVITPTPVQTSNRAVGSFAVGSQAL